MLEDIIVKDEDLILLFDKATELKEHDPEVYENVIKNLGRFSPGEFATIRENETERYETANKPKRNLYIALSGLWYGYLIRSISVNICNFGWDEFPKAMYSNALEGTIHFDKHRNL